VIRGHGFVRKASAGGVPDLGLSAKASASRRVTPARKGAGPVLGVGFPA
jgi:hypothetical protein